MYSLSCADYTWPALSHPVVLAIIADIGFEGVDVGVFAEDTHVKLSQVMEDPAREADHLLQRVAPHGLDVADVFFTPSMDLNDLTPSHPSADQQERSYDLLSATIEFASRVGVSGVTMLPGVVHPADSYGSAIERASQSLRRRVELAGEKGLSLSVEPHFGSCIDTPERTATMLEKTPGLSITLDPSHYVFSGATMGELNELLPRTRHVQIRPGSPGVMQSRVRDGEIDLEFLVDALLASDYEGWLAAEYVWMEKWGCDAVDNTTETTFLKAELDRILAEHGQG